MVILIQLAVFVIVFVLRRRRLLGKHLSAHGDGEANQLMHVSKSKGSITGRSVGLIHKNPLPFIIRKERFYDRWLKAVGLAREVQAHDKEMDDRWFFITDYPRDLERLVRANSFQEELGKLFEMGITALYATSERIWCTLGKDLDEDDRFYEQYYTVLRELSDKLATSTPYADPTGKRKHYQPLAFLAIGLHLTIFISAIVGFFGGLFDDQRIVHLWDWIGLSTSIGVGVLIVWGLLLLSYFKGTSWVGWVLADFVLSGIAGILLLSFVLVREANIELDEGEAAIQGVPVMKKTCELKCKRGHGKRSRTSTHELLPEQCTATARPSVQREYQQAYSRCLNKSWFHFELTVKQWDDTKEPFTFNANQRMFDALQEGELVTVPVHEGYMGLEWVPVGDIKPLGKRY